MATFSNHCHSFGLHLIPLVLISVFSSAIVLVIIIPLWLYRLVVLLIVRSFRRDLLSIITGLRATFTINGPHRAASNILLGFVIQGETTSDRISQLFQERVLHLRDPHGTLIYQQLQQTWTNFMGYAFWKHDPYFDLRKHVRDYDYKEDELLLLPKNPDEQDLQRIWPVLAEGPWEINQSPWELLVVQNYCHQGNKTKPHTLIIFRVDHVHCDAYSIVGLFRILFQSPFKMPKPSRNNLVLSPWEHLKVILTLSYEVNKIIYMFLKGRKLGERAPSMSNTYCSISSNISVDAIKSIKRKFGVGFSTVVLAAVNGAIARAIRIAGGKPPVSMDLGYVLPLSNHPGGLNLHATALHVELPCSVQCPGERLYQTQEVLEKSEGSLGPMALANTSDLLALAPLPILRTLLFQIFKLGPSFYMSNSPTTLTKDYVDGSEIVDVFTALTVFKYLGMAITSCGVNNQQRFNFFLDRSIFGDETSAVEIATFFEEELETLRNLSIPANDHKLDVYC